MHRPLETTFWMRLKQFLKGVFFYNTIYWNRASDDLEIQRMSREERASLRPMRNLDIIRPREQPRAAAVISLPADGPAPRSRVELRAELGQVSLPTGELLRDAAQGADDGSTLEIRRRKKRRGSRHSKVMPKQYYDQAGSGSKIFGWLFRK